MTNKWIDVVSQVAPAIASAIGGPLAGNAVGALLKVFGVESEAQLDKAVANASPEQLLLLKQADNEFKLAYLNAEVKDKSDARNMQNNALQQEDKFAKRFVHYFAIFWSVVASLYIGFITFGNIPQTSIRFADTILGFLLGTIVTTIIQFFYGSSFGSRLKDERKL